MATFEDVSKVVEKEFDEVEKFVVVPMTNFLTDLQLKKKERHKHRMVRVTLLMRSDEMFSDPDDVGSPLAATPVVGFLKLKKDGD